MTDDDLIRRGDALDEINLYRSEWDYAREAITALPAERDALTEAQIDAIRAALEAAAEVCEWHEVYSWNECRDAIHTLDPAAIAAKLKGEKHERA